MSLETWKVEFFPYSQEEVALLARKDNKTQLEAALLKWQGLRPENLAKHGVRKLRETHCNYEISDEERTLWINHVTCSLCVAHSECESCPLVEQGADCCEKTPSEGTPPYGLWRVTGDPELMIQRIERALARETL
jgi:hypothetical protein